jgi:dihydrofolate synthase/folylpolyglutamate synthase
MHCDRSYQETIDYLYALQKHGVKLALANTVALMDLLGNPHERFRAVHVAGTNGKGSTSAFLASMLQAAGYRVGLYTSPHLVSFSERIRINGIAIPEARVVDLARRVRAAYQQEPAAPGTLGLNPTFFEVTTAMAFTCFAEEAVDIAVIEAGMGGRLDATNVITPLASVITNIDLEHQEFLGTTIEQIAAEKAGIVKKGAPVVTGAVQPEVLAVIQQKAHASEAGLYVLGSDFKPEAVSSQAEQRFDYRGIRESYRGLTISLLGRHQVDNACLALAALECVRSSGVAVEEPALRRGLEQARWEGRLERVSRTPDMYLDGAHNPASAAMLAEAIKQLMKDYRRLVLVIGILGDKDFSGIISAIVPLAHAVIVTRPDYARAMDVAALAAEVRKEHNSVETAETVVQAIEKARGKASAEDVILITGSLYVVGDARAALVADAGQRQALSGLKG